MSEISGSSNYIDQLSWQEPQTEISDQPKDTMLSQEDFFQLLTQQLAYQDPFKPVENAEMVAQMSSFTTAEGIGQLNEQMTGLNSIMSSSQALQASSLVGQKVLVPTGYSHKTDTTGIDGVVSLSAPTNNVTVRIEDTTGQVVHSITMGAKEAGNARFEWDGTDASGNQLPQGNYVVKAYALQGDSSVELPISTYAKVDSVSISGANGVALNLQGIQGGFRLSDVLEVAKG
ncbi:MULTISPECIES: flagellar hook assembly protein FlgD [Corallincola]|uniref:Basal-body rod modification protein FlgD n=3 Tax=Corallincola TaxID=1775176 RepID=A0A368N4Z6_9GAMM|nr:MULTISPECIES: flagellar hook assembly protein FlgD [Corallincola]RCU44595.1 flagellar hook assembly protein FlgD [Corallincola holothuriorum]TAA40340.1 flagellar hook assembly protein FlgD [Corallincola spongiicola]TCI05353.1 flagellar hook assembly protein FlgD [Corallincola luteus]